MLYQSYEMQRMMRDAASAWSAMASEMFSSPAMMFATGGQSAVPAAALDVYSHATAPRGKPTFGIDVIELDGQTFPLAESVVLRRPFGNLLRFAHAGLPADAPRLLIAVPMSGHYATLLRGTVERMATRAVVYVTDWADAREVPLTEGHFDLDDYIDYLIAFLEHIGPGAHMLAVCQPSVPCFAATAIMGASNHPCRPATLTMMGGPIDTRQSPTEVNRLALERPLSWYENSVIATVPAGYPGSGREVYPGFLQLTSFMSMNLANHLNSHYAMFKNELAGEDQKVAATKTFYEEYRSVCDMTAEFYLQTVDKVFQQQALARGKFTHRGLAVDPGAIRDTAIFAIEGERDDISGIGQTKAALDLASGLAATRKKYVLAEGVGHYGIFNGSAWRSRIAPLVEEWILQHEVAR